MTGIYILKKLNFNKPVGRFVDVLPTTDHQDGADSKNLSVLHAKNSHQLTPKLSNSEDNE